MIQYRFVDLKKFLGMDKKILTREYIKLWRFRNVFWMSSFRPKTNEFF